MLRLGFYSKDFVLMCQIGWDSIRKTLSLCVYYAHRGQSLSSYYPHITDFYVKVGILFERLCPYVSDRLGFYSKDFVLMCLLCTPRPKSFFVLSSYNGFLC